MSWYSGVVRWRETRRARRTTNHLIEVAATQADNNPDMRVDADHPLTVGEGLILSGVKQAVHRAIAPHAKRIESLQATQERELDAATAARAEQAALETREHVVGGSGRVGARRRAELPEQLGDAITTRAARTEHERIAGEIDADVAAGRRRHLNGVSRRWMAVTHLLLFVDVLALFVLMARVESVGFTAVSWQKDAPGQAIKLVTALGFAALGALMLALTGHRVGSLLWQWVHRGPASTENPAGHKERRTRMLLTEPRLLLWGVVLVGVSALTGLTIAMRILAAAEGTSFAHLVPVVALMIGVAGGLAPILVAVTTAQRPSPEVVRRDALAGIVAAVHRRHEELDSQISARETAAERQAEDAGRVLAAARRDADLAALPAEQAVKELRARFGYAGHHDRRVPVFTVVDGSSDSGLDDLARIETTVAAMRVAVARTHESTLTSRRTRHDRPVATGNRFSDNTVPAAIAIGSLPRNGHPVGAAPA